MTLSELLRRIQAAGLALQLMGGEPQLTARGGGEVDRALADWVVKFREEIVRHLTAEERRQAGGLPSPADIPVGPGRLRRSNPMAAYARSR